MIYACDFGIESVKRRRRESICHGGLLTEKFDEKNWIIKEK